MKILLVEKLAVYIAVYIKENRGENKVEEVNWNEYLNKDIDVELPKSNIVTKIGKAILWIIFKLYIRVKKEGTENITTDPVIYMLETIKVS